ncbi:hypothetical protein Hanom_Chr08g00734911 [Helianthus anomalus]
METCKGCTEKDDNIRSRDIEFTKIERIFKGKCHEMLENERFFKEKEKELTKKCEDLEKENKMLKEKCSTICNECVPNDKIIQKLQK